MAEQTSKKTCEDKSSTRRSNEVDQPVELTPWQKHSCIIAIFPCIITSTISMHGIEYVLSRGYTSSQSCRSVSLDTYTITALLSYGPIVIRPDFHTLSPVSKPNPTLHMSTNKLFRIKTWSYKNWAV